MSKRNAILLAGGIALLIVLILTNFGRNLPFGSSMRPHEFPNKRPARPDQKQLRQFSDKSIGEILSALTEDTSSAPEKTVAESLLEILPAAPLPYPEEVAPTDPNALRKFIESIQQGTLGDPTLLDRWRYNLAASAMRIGEESRPDDLRISTTLPFETESFPVRLKRQIGELQGPLALGDFDGRPGWEIVSEGGAQLLAVGEDGSLMPLNSLSGVVGGRQIYPADFDSDGDLDLFLTRGDGLPNSLLRNSGTGQFDDVTIELGLLGFSDTSSAAWLDYDNDGRLDLLIGNHDHPLELYQQTSGGTFQPIAWDLGLWIPQDVVDIQTADINSDGLPDIYLALKNRPDQLLLTTPAPAWSDWRFDDVSGASRLWSSPLGSVARFFDFDNDGDQDLLVGDPAKSGETLQAELLAEETHPGDEETSAPSNQPVLKTDSPSPESEPQLAPPKPGSPEPPNVDTASLAEANPAAEEKPGPSPLRLYQNRGDGIFTDVTDAISLTGALDVQSIGIADIDSDGFQDILVGSGQLALNRAYWNRHGLEFRDVSVVGQFSYLDHFAQILSEDLDGDGAIDILASSPQGKVKWLESEGGDPGWLGIDLEGSRPGTRVALVVRDRDWILQTVTRTASVNSHLTFGLGYAESVESISVYAPDGEEPVKTLGKQKPNQNLSIHVPKVPRKRAHLPMEEEQAQSAQR